MANTLDIVSTVSFILAFIFLVLAVILWIKFQIIHIIGDLSGRTAKKSIAKMREKNEKTGKKSFKPSSENLQRGKLTDKMKDSEKFEKGVGKTIEEQPETGLLSENQLYNSTENITELLEDDCTTGLLNEKEIDRFNGRVTTILNEKAENNLIKVTDDINFTMVDEVMLIHTDEMI